MRLGEKNIINKGIDVMAYCQSNEIFIGRSVHEMQSISHDRREMPSWRINRGGEGGKKEREKEKKAVRRVSSKLHCWYNAVPWMLFVLSVQWPVTPVLSPFPDASWPLHSRYDPRAENMAAIFLSCIYSRRTFFNLNKRTSVRFSSSTETHLCQSWKHVICDFTSFTWNKNILRN